MKGITKREGNCTKGRLRILCIPKKKILNGQDLGPLSFSVLCMIETESAVAIIAACFLLKLHPRKVLALRICLISIIFISRLYATLCLTSLVHWQFHCRLLLIKHVNRIYFYYIISSLQMWYFTRWSPLYFIIYLLFGQTWTYVHSVSNKGTQIRDRNTF